MHYIGTLKELRRYDGCRVYLKWHNDYAKVLVEDDGYVYLLSNILKLRGAAPRFTKVPKEYDCSWCINTEEYFRSTLQERVGPIQLDTLIGEL